MCKWLYKIDRSTNILLSIDCLRITNDVAFIDLRGHVNEIVLSHLSYDVSICSPNGYCS
jgi:hypothetical protein